MVREYVSHGTPKCILASSRNVWEVWCWVLDLGLHMIILGGKSSTFPNFLHRPTWFCASGLLDRSLAGARLTHARDSQWHQHQASRPQPGSQFCGRGRRSRPHFVADGFRAPQLSDPRVYKILFTRARTHAPYSGSRPRAPSTRTVLAFFTSSSWSTRGAHDVCERWPSHCG